MSEMTLAAHEWKNTDWAQKKDFMQSTGTKKLDIDLSHFTKSSLIIRKALRK
jgi:methylglutaconyl-CoA hydratase